MLSGACVERAGRAVLADLTLDLRVTRLGVVGRNGSGKSTLSRLLAGLFPPDRGEVAVAGKDLAKDRRAALATVGILFQNPDQQIIFPTVLEELSFGLTQQGMKKRAAEERSRAILARMGRPDWAETSIATLSQGQKHLVCLMAIVAMGPRLLILDEPFAGLDIPTKAQLTRALGHFDGDVIHVTHDPRDIAHYDQALWLDGGRIRQIGTSGEVLAAYTQEMNRLGEADDILDLSR